MEIPSIRFARTDDGVRVPYWTRGRGRPLLLSPNVQLGHARAEWSVPAMRGFFERLARGFELVRYDHGGGRLSITRGTEPRTWAIDALVRDIDAVVEATAAGPAVLLGWLAGAPVAVAYAARHPDRVSHLVLWNGFARDASHGQAPRLRSLFAMARTDWELFTESLAQAALGWRDAAEARGWAAVAREATTQEGFLAYLAARREWDVTSDLARVRCPALVLHDRANALASEARSRELAAGIPGAHFLECGSDGGVPDEDAVTSICHFVGLGQPQGLEMEELTPREREVLALVAEGVTNAQIAERLFISVNTVTRHLTHIYRKTGTRRRTEATRLAIERGLRPG